MSATRYEGAALLCSICSISLALSPSLNTSVVISRSFRHSASRLDHKLHRAQGLDRILRLAPLRRTTEVVVRVACERAKRALMSLAIVIAVIIIAVVTVVVAVLSLCLSLSLRSTCCRLHWLDLLPSMHILLFPCFLLYILDS